MKINFSVSIIILLSWCKFTFANDLVWGNIPVVWVEDESIPTFNVTIYFGDGSLSDPSGMAGLTSVTFDQLFSGTNRYTQNEISDHLDYFGASFGVSSNFEYSTIGFAGLMKDLVPITKMVCHVIQDASFPQEHLSNAIARRISSINNIGHDPRMMAQTAFKSLIYKSLPYETPSNGFLRTLGKITQRHLNDKWSYFKNNVSKKIYISGPKGIEAIKNLITQDCGLQNRPFLRNEKFSLGTTDPQKIYLIPFKEGNQSTLLFGRLLPFEKETQATKLLVSTILGGESSNSILMEELRNKSGLTYGAYSHINHQRNYSVALIQSSTANKQLIPFLKVFETTLQNFQSGKFENAKIEQSRSFLKGQFLFELEKSTDYLDAIMIFEHTQRPRQEILSFTQRMSAVTNTQVYNFSKQIFDYSSFVKVIVGHPESAKELVANGHQVVIMDIASFL